MAVIVESNADQVQAYTTGNGVFPVSPEIAADNAVQAAKKAGSTENTGIQETKEVKPDEGSAEKAKSIDQSEDIEGDDGLTPRQKREFTKSMLATIAKKHRAQKEAEEFATREYNEKMIAEERAQALAAENAALKAQIKPSEKVSELKEPQREAFKSDQEYWDAMVDYRVDKKLQIAQAEQAQRDEERRQQEIVAHARAKVERAIELVPDYKEITEAVDTIVPPFVAAYMQESDLLAELGYHFAKHADVLDRLTKITEGIKEGSPAFVKAVSKQLVELGKIESTLSPFSKEKATAQPSQDTVTQTEKETGIAPSKPRAPIIQPLNSGSAAQVLKDEADMTGSQVITSWQKKHGVVLTARKRH